MPLRPLSLCLMKTCRPPPLACLQPEFTLTSPTPSPNTG